MESSLCTKRLKNKPLQPCSSQEIGRVDRLSSLPDRLLTNIISLLPTTKDAIRTSLLSTRWNYLWTCLPNYKFIYQYPDPELPPGAAAGDDEYKSFINSVDRLLLHLHDHQLHIDNFSVKSSYHIKDNPDVDSWISTLLTSCDIKKISLKFQYILVCLLPNTLLTCKTLVSLKLQGKFKLDLSAASSTVFLPNLKTLWLMEVKYSNEETLSRLLSGCPILEDLAIERLDNDVQRLNIAVPSLKWLSLDFICYALPGDFATIIDAPNLEILILADYSSKYIYLHKPSLLVRGYVDVAELRPSLDPDLMEALLLAVSDVRTLTLGSSTIAAISIDNPHLPTFRNVRDLTLRMNLAQSSEVLMNLLESMPNLQQLIIEVLAEHGTAKFAWSPPEIVPNCLSSHLKTIEIGDFYGGEDELKLVKYFMENGKVLENITISPYNDSPPWVAFDEDRWLMSQEKLSKSPFGSSACQLSFIKKASKWAF